MCYETIQSGQVTYNKMPLKCGRALYNEVRAKDLPTFNGCTYTLFVNLCKIMPCMVTLTSGMLCMNSRDPNSGLVQFTNM